MSVKAASRPPTESPRSLPTRAAPKMRGSLSLLWLLLIGLAIASPLAAQAGGAAPAKSSSSSNPLSSLLPGKAAASTPQPSASAAPASAEPQSPQPIPLPDVALRAEEITRKVRDIRDQLPTKEQLNVVKATLDEREEPLQAKEKEVEALLSGSPSALEYREQETYWRETELECAALRRQLRDWAGVALTGVEKLQQDEPQWKATLDANRNAPDLGPTLDLITQTVESLQRTEAQAQDLLRLIVNLQVRAANQDLLALDVLDHLQVARTQLQGRLLHRDSPPLWEAMLRGQSQSPELFRNTDARVIGIKSFVRENTGLLAALAVILLLSLTGMYRIHRACRGVEPDNELQAKALGIVHYWFAVGLLPPLLVFYLLAPIAPLPLIAASMLVSFIPIFLLLPPLIEVRFRALLQWLACLYVVTAVIAWITLSAVRKREMQFLFFLAVLVVFAYLLRPSRVKQAQTTGIWHKLLVFAIRFVLMMIIVALVANVFGFVKLAQYLGGLCLYGTFVALAVFTGVRVFITLLLAGLRAPSAERLAAVRLHREGIARWGPRLARWTGILLWLGATLDLLGIRSWTNNWLGKVLDFKIAGGSANITLGSVLGLWTILLAGYAFSAILRFLLREELLKRFHLQRGVPELISTTIHYLLLVLVFLLAVNQGGVALNKFTVITGALGVGVGFGLQNVINNFVSGLILQFERPIRVNDVLDVDGTAGTVTRIGIRSSTLLTFQGAEVIIPNANFISGKVINWTLSEARRRLELPVGVAYGTDPKLVKQLLERAATEHGDVLTQPAPEAFFMEFGDSALNFELRFWVMQESNTVKVKSDVALAAMDFLNEAGIEIPFPQRDLRLRSVAEEAAAALAGNESKTVTRENDSDIELHNHRRSPVAGE